MDNNMNLGESVLEKAKADVSSVQIFKWYICRICPCDDGFGGIIMMREMG